MRTKDKKERLKEKMKARKAKDRGRKLEEEKQPEKEELKEQDEEEQKPRVHEIDENLERLLKEKFNSVYQGNEPGLKLLCEYTKIVYETDNQFDVAEKIFEKLRQKVDAHATHNEPECVIKFGNPFSAVAKNVIDKCLFLLKLTHETLP